MHANQIRVDTEINNIKEAIIMQQRYIEKVEAEKRVTNVVIHGMSESSIPMNDITLKDDVEKVEYLSRVLNANMEYANCVGSVFRLGSKDNARNRP